MESPASLEEYWDWVTVAPFLLVTVDTLPAMFGAAALGQAVEANPLMRWELGRDPATLVAMNVTAWFSRRGSCTRCGRCSTVFPGASLV